MRTTRTILAICLLSMLLGGVSYASDIALSSFHEEMLINAHIEGGQKWTEAIGLVGGEAVAVWTDAYEDESGSDIKGQLFDAEGNMLGSEFYVGDALYTSGAEVCSLDNGGFVVVWEQRGSGSRRFGEQ